MTTLARSIETWRCCDPRAMACMSEAAVEYALKDARHDILLLARQRDALLAVLREAVEKPIRTEGSDWWGSVNAAIAEAES